MKTVLCGLGKCGCRMALDFNSLIFNGKFSYQLKIPKERLHDEEKKGFWSWLFSNKNTITAQASNIHQDEVPHIHMGDADNENEVVNMCLAHAKDEKDNTDENQQRESENEREIRKRLKEDIIEFSNYQGACGQYHIIGEQVMDNLIKEDCSVQKKIINAYINRDTQNENVSAYLLLFSAGGGTGCGTSTTLAKSIAQRAKEECVNMLVAGVAALPGTNESENYKISAGRFLTKFLSAERSTFFDTIFTISNAIMEEMDEDLAKTQTQANLFAANFICSLINSSSKHHRSPINTDGPELRKNIHGLSYFCYGQQEKAGDDDSLIGMDLLVRALRPASTYAFNDGEEKSESPFKELFGAPKDESRKEKTERACSFQGSSIRLDDTKFTKQHLKAMVETIQNFKQRVLEENPEKDIVKLRQQAAGLFTNPREELPLAMRSCQNVVVLRGIPDTGKASSWEQTVLTTMLEELFPKAIIHYYCTYHKMSEDTLVLIPSNYISREILALICTYLMEVWRADMDNETSKELKKALLSKMLGNDNDISTESLEALLGEREHFELKFPDFQDMKDRLTGRFNLTEEDWEPAFTRVEDVASMMARVQNIAALVKRERDTTDPLDEIDL